MLQNNRWHPCLLPDNYQRKLKQDLAEAAAARPASRLEPETQEQEGENGRKQVRVAGLTQPSPKLD